MTIVRKYFPALSNEPCTLCGSATERNRPPGVWFATEGGQWVCTVCCFRHGRKAWREAASAETQERRRQKAENREEDEAGEEKDATHDC